MVQIRETTDKPAICPHCEKTLGRMNAIKTKSAFGVRFVYSCGHCNKVLGVSHRKGFWMG